MKTNERKVINKFPNNIINSKINQQKIAKKKIS